MENIDIDNIFSCCFCGSLVDDPYESECCGKLYCRGCTEMNKFYDLCKFCHKSLKFRKNLFARNLLNKVELKCKYDCGEKYSYENMKIHMCRCVNKNYNCTLKYCVFSGKKSELIIHMTQEHQIHLLTMMENFEEFKEKMDFISRNPVDSSRINVNEFVERHELGLSILNNHEEEHSFPNPHNINVVDQMDSPVRGIVRRLNHSYDYIVDGNEQINWNSIRIPNVYNDHSSINDSNIGSNNISVLENNDMIDLSGNFGDDNTDCYGDNDCY